MPESDVWLLSVKDGVSKRLGYVAALGQMLGPALRKTTALALTVTTFNMAAYWFKTIWLPTYLHETRGLSLGDVAWLLLMDQIGSVVGYVAFGFCQRPLRPASELHRVLDHQGARAGDGHARLERSPAATRATTFGFMLLVGFGEGNWGCIGPLLNEVFPTSVRAAALGIIYNTARGVQFLAPVDHRHGGGAVHVRRRHRARRAVRAARRRDGVGAAGNQGRAADAEERSQDGRHDRTMSFAGDDRASAAVGVRADGRQERLRRRQDVAVPARSAPDACAVDLTTTVVAADGTLTREAWKANPNAPIDCFYVYPTVSTDTGGNSDMEPGPEENGVVRAQLARFASQCKRLRAAVSPGDADGAARRDDRHADRRSIARSATTTCSTRGTTTCSTTTTAAASC